MVNPAIQDKRVYFKVRPKGFSEWCVCETRDDAMSIVNGNPPEEYDIEEVCMTPRQFLKMKEFGGW